MSRYRRAKIAGGIFFFTVALAGRLCAPCAPFDPRSRRAMISLE